MSRLGPVDTTVQYSTVSRLDPADHLLVAGEVHHRLLPLLQASAQVRGVLLAINMEHMRG